MTSRCVRRFKGRRAQRSRMRNVARERSKRREDDTVLKATRAKKSRMSVVRLDGIEDLVNYFKKHAAAEFSKMALTKESTTSEGSSARKRRRLAETSRRRRGSRMCRAKTRAHPMKRTTTRISYRTRYGRAGLRVHLSTVP